MNKDKFILAIDQGTTSTRAILFDKEGCIAGKAQREFKQIYPFPGHVEHNPLEIWGSVTGVMSEVVSACNITMQQVEAIGITNQRETTVVWDRESGVPVHNAIVWQCRRTAEYCTQLIKSGYERFIYDKTGLMPDAYFSATKVKWILENVAGAKEKAESGKLCFGTIDTFLMWKLSGGKIFATDYTNAARTMLFNIHSLQWDDELLKLFGIPRCMLPNVKPSKGLFGMTDRSVTGCEKPITGVAGDQQSALYGQNCLQEGSVKNTYGTGCFMLMNTGSKAIDSTHGLITTLAADADASGKPHYVLEGSVFVGGAAVQWLRDEMRLIKTAEDSERYAMAVKDSGGVYVVPAFVGLGAPYWDSSARGTICGITRGTKKEHIIRATLESIAYQCHDLLRAMQRDTGCEIPFLKVDGGASANNFLMQFQSDIAGLKVVRNKMAETTALGAARLSGESVGVYSLGDCGASEDLKGRIFLPNMKNERRTAFLTGWAEAVGRTRYK